MALANPTGELDALGGKADVIVIGSGYGAGVCAARLAEAGASVVILERGREYAFGADKPFPATSSEVSAETQIDGFPFGRTHRLGLLNFHVNRDLDVLVGCGLGGTSLINANVSIKPDRRVLERDVWPAEIRAEVADGTIDRYYELARGVLDPSHYPEDRPQPRKLVAMLANGATRTLNNVHYQKAGPNSVGVKQETCTDCGDCMTGCNSAAKKTLCFTYLPIAKSYGAKIFVQCDVHHLEQAADGTSWTIAYQRLVRGDEPMNPTERLTAKTVIVAAGVLGTTGILLRSKAAGVPISDELGGRVSGNGDAVALAYNCNDRMDSVGCGVDIPYLQPRPAKLPPTGASILAVIDKRDTPNVDDGIILEEGAFPSGTARLMRYLVQAIAGVTGSETQHGFTHWFHERIAEGRDLFGIDLRDGALDHTLVFLLMGHDGADGEIELDDEARPRIKWPELHERGLFGAENAVARAVAARLGGMFVTDPLNTKLMLNNNITVHPLGGCPMGEDHVTGVVDHAGRVFRDDGKTFPGLYVSDASVIPTSLGVNPLWTITALAERIAEHVARDLGLVAGTSNTLKPGVVVTP